MPEPYSVVLEGVTFSYEGSDNPVLKEVDLKIKRGEMTAILGRTGAGKSTLIYSLGGIIPNYIKGNFAGDIIVEGLNTKDHGLYEIAQHVGVVMDDPEAHIVSFTVWEDTAFGPCNLGLPAEEIYNRIDFALKATRLDDMRTRNPYNLSGGEKQGLAIAGVLSMRPSILALDEPTSMLDPLGRERVRTVLKDLKERYGMTFIISDYDANRIIGVADRLVILDKGEVALDGRCRDILQDVETLEKVGVHLPEVTKLAAQLRTDGFWDGELPTTIEEAASMMKKRLRRTSGPGLAEVGAHTGSGEIMVKIRNLHHVFSGDVHALRGVDLDIHSGEYVALIGQNGSGKTTLAKHIGGLLKPTNKDAEISVAGLDLRNARMQDIASRVGYIFQIPEHQMFCATVGEELRFGLKNLGISEEEADRRAKDVATKLELTGLEDELLPSLNRGRRFRVVLGSVIAMNPEVVVVDEPTTGQDWKDSVYVCRFLEELRAGGKTIIVITHEMDLVASFATRVIALHQGSVLLDGTPKEIFSKTEELKKTWVQPPDIFRLSMSLANYGVPPNVLTADEMRGKIAKLRGRGWS